MRLHGLSRRGFTAGSYLITLGTAARRHTNRARGATYTFAESERERERGRCATGEERFCIAVFYREISVQLTREFGVIFSSNHDFLYFSSPPPLLHETICDKMCLLLNLNGRFTPAFLPTSIKP